MLLLSCNAIAAAMFDGVLGITVEAPYVNAMANKVRALDLLAWHFGMFQELPPLEVVLASLPTELAQSVRASLAAAATPPPSTVNINTG